VKYSIVTSANKSYLPFLDIFINSVFKNCNQENLQKIYIIDCGLGEYSKIFDNNKIELIDTGLNDEYSGVHSKGWVKATRSKTQGLLKILKEKNINDPIILIDSDVCVLQELSLIIDTNYDLQATVMHDGGHTRADGIFIKEIASFVCFNNIEKSILFLEQWIDKIKFFEDNSIPFPHETPAFNYTLRKNEQDMKILSLNENEVCADLKILPETLSVHFKSNGSTSLNAYNNFISRVTSVQNYSNKNFNFEEYLNKELFSKWRLNYET
jgi:hypothetical protein